MKVTRRGIGSTFCLAGIALVALGIEDIGMPIFAAGFVLVAWQGGSDMWQYSSKVANSRAFRFVFNAAPIVFAIFVIGLFSGELIDRARNDPLTFGVAALFFVGVLGGTLDFTRGES